MAGTASTVRAFLLVEHPGPWGDDALRDARLPDGLGARAARRAAATGSKVLLIRRPAGRRPHARASGSSRRTPTRRARGSRPPSSTTCAGVLDLDLAALGAGRSPGLTPYDGSVLCVCTHGRHDACCAERGRPVAAGAGRGAPRGDLGGLAHRRRPVRGEPARAAARPLLRAARPGVAPARGRPPPPASSTSTTCAAAPGWRSRCRPPRWRCAGTSMNAASPPYVSSLARCGTRGPRRPSRSTAGGTSCS